MSLSASSFPESERLSDILNGSAKRIDSSKTASDDRENVSHYSLMVNDYTMGYHGRINFLSIEHVVVGPEFANTEALVETAVLVCLSEKPWRVHEVLSCSQRLTLRV